jgi:hypothetical protein
MNLNQNAPGNLVIVSLGAALVAFFIGVTVVLAVTGSAPTAMWAAGAAVSGALIGLLVPQPSQQTAAQAGSATASHVVQGAALQAAQRQADQTASEAPEMQADVQDALQRVKDLSSTIQATNAIRGATLAPEEAGPAAAQNARLMFKALASAAVEENQPAAKQDVYKAAADVAANNVQTAAEKGAAAASAAGGAGKISGTVLVLMVVFAGLLAIGLGMSFIPSEGDQLIKEAGKTVLALASSAGGAVIGVLAPPSPQTA